MTNKKLTLHEIKEKLRLINRNIKINATEYINNKTPFECECLICGTVWKMNWNNLSNSHGCPTCYYNSKLISEDEIIKCITDSGYKFVEFIKKGKLINEYRLKVKCPENHVYSVDYHNFQSGKRCKKCANKKIAESRKNNIEDVINFINENGYSIVGEFNYENNKSEFTISCQKGHLRKTSYNTLTQYPSCYECTYGHKTKYSEEDITNILEELGMEYISGYIDSRTPFQYRCTCGNIAYNSLNLIKRGVKCSNCSPITTWNYEEVKKIFESFGCELLSSTFENVKQKLEFKCRCGRTGCKILHDFINSPQCPDCGLEKRSGENHPNWNPNLTDEERFKNRKFKEYDQWRLAVYERDNYTCQCCGDNKGSNLNAHHLDSHDWAIDKRLDLDNAITLCELCHTDFHNIYGYGENTKEQFKEYMEDLYNNAI